MIFRAVKWGDIINVYLIFQKYNRDFTSFAISITKDKEQGFDLVQDAYVSALEREDIFEIMNEYQIKGWFFTTIKNKHIDNIRKQKKMIYFENEHIFQEHVNFEENVVIKELIDRLPDKNKEVVLLRYYMNLNSTEIGKALGISPSTVRSRLSVSIQMLKEKL